MKPSPVIPAAWLLLGSLACIGLFADLIAASVPIAMTVEGRLYVLPGLTAPRLAHAVASQSIPAGWALWPLIAPDQAMASAATEAAGLATQVTWWVQGCRHWLFVTGATSLLALLGGTLLGTSAGLGSRTADALLARAVELAAILPTVVMIALVQMLNPGSSTIAFVLVVASSSALLLARIVRQRTRQIASEPFVLSVRALGASRWQLFRGHIAWHLAPTLATGIAVTAATVASLDTALHFLQMGPKTHYPSWGAVLGDQAATGALDAASLPPLVSFILTIGSIYVLGRSKAVPGQPPREVTGWDCRRFRQAG